MEISFFLGLGQSGSEPFNYENLLIANPKSQSSCIVTV